ncbi:hypothetical protein D3C81_2272830 [compost metagenome]
MKLTSPAVPLRGWLLRWYMVVPPKSPITPGKTPGNWEGTLGVGNDGSVTATARWPGKQGV